MHSISRNENEGTNLLLQSCALAGRILLVIWVTVFLAGCRLTRPCCDYTNEVPLAEKTRLSPQDPGQLNDIRMPLIEESEKGVLPNGFDQVYPLTLRDCERLAAQNSPLSKVLEQELGATDPCNSCSRVDPCIVDTVNALVQASSAYQRNNVVEKALLAYLGLAEVYLQNQIAEETVAEIESLQEVLEQLQDEGLLREFDPEILVRQRLEAMQSQHELLYNFEKLNENLRAILGLDATSHPIWTDCQIDGWVPPTDLGNEIQIALQNRSDLQALELMAHQGNDQLLEAMRSSVRSVSPLGGLVLQRRLFGGYFADHSAEMQKLRNQLSLLQAAQTDLAKSTVAENYYLIHKHYEQIQLNQKRLNSLRKSENRLDAKRQVGAIKVEEVLNIKAEILKARSATIHSAVELQMAWIKMKAAQGMLGVGSQEVEGIALEPEAEMIHEQTDNRNEGLARAAAPQLPTQLRLGQHSQRATVNETQSSERLAIRNNATRNNASRHNAKSESRPRLDLIPLR